MLALLFMEITGAFSLVALWKSQETLTPGTLELELVRRAAFFDGDGGPHGQSRDHGRRHPPPGDWERPGGSNRRLHALEDGASVRAIARKFAELMTASKWWWAFMMDMHFVGLALLIGTVGILDLRMLGFAKQIPIDPLHRLVPWAMAGFGINLVTGILAFTGMSSYYTYDWAFWLKMLAIMLLGLECGGILFDRRFRFCRGFGSRRGCAAVRQIYCRDFSGPLVCGHHLGPVHPVLFRYDLRP